MFGALTGGGVSINKMWQLWMTRSLGGKEYKKLARNPAYVAFGRGLNFAWFALTLVWFWGDWKTIGRIYRALSLSEWICVWLAIWLTATSVLALWEWLRQRLMSIRSAEGPIFSSRYARVVYASALGFIAFVVTVLLHQAAPDIVYRSLLSFAAQDTLWLCRHHYPRG